MKYLKNRNSHKGGYTIIETMIVLVVSATLFGTVASAISRQNRRTQFTQSVGDLQQKLADVLNDIETGYYPSNNGFSCSASPSSVPPDIDYSVGANQGENKGCIFIGKYFNVSGDGSKMDITTIAGRQKIGGDTSQDVDNISDAKPVEVTSPIDTLDLSSGLKIIRLVKINGDPLPNNDFAVLTGFSGTGNTDATRAVLSTIPGAGVSGLLESNLTEAKDGLLLCLTDDERKATITIGGLNTGDPAVVIDSTDTRCPT